MDMSQYIDVFLEESKEHLEEINNNILELEKRPEDINIVQEIFRSAHTLKGMAGSMGYTDMSSLTHEMEDVLDLIRNGKLKINGHIIDVILNCVDLLQEMVSSVSTGGDGSCYVEDTVEKLKQLVLGEFSSEGNSTSTNKILPMEKNIQLEDSHLNIIQQALQADFNAYWIKVTLEKSCQLKAARAYMVVVNLEQIGEIIVSHPTTQKIEEEAFDNEFELLILSDRSQEEVEKKILSVSEIHSVTVESIESEINRLTSGVLTPEQNNQHIKSVTLEDSNQKSELKKTTSSGKTIRVDVEKLDALMNLFGQLVIEKGRLEQIGIDSGDSKLNESLGGISRISNELQNLILSVRMVQINQVFSRFPRMVRDLSKELGKKINFTVEGEETELDRTFIDEIGDPLVHIIRNSIDHGIETPEVRKASHKDEEGNLNIQAYYSGSHIFIRIEDDGAGINRSKVLEKAIKNGIVKQEDANKMSDREVYKLLFASGFSTADKVSDISGRGVGLDVVKSKIESLGGEVQVDSVEGKGTTFLIKLPLTLSIMDAMIVKVGIDYFAIPINSIEEIAVYSPNEIQKINRQEVIDFRGKITPLIRLQKILGSKSAEDNDDCENVIFVKKGNQTAGLVVSSVLRKQEIVLKSLGTFIEYASYVSSATILGDGQVALILDIPSLIP